MADNGLNSGPANTYFLAVTQMENYLEDKIMQQDWAFYLKLVFHMSVRDVVLDLRRSLMERMKKLKLIRPNTATPATRALVTVSSGEEGSLADAISKSGTEKGFQ